jgi:chromatin remodeling complex protein RSC6
MATKGSTSTKRKSSSALQKPVKVSGTLAAVVGHGPMPRTEVTKKLWDYIKKHKLQSSTDKRQITVDEKLSAVFGIPAKRTVHMLEMPGKLKSHLTSI